MSEASAEAAVGANAMDVRARAAQWATEQTFAEHWSTENQAALDAWLAESPAHEVAYVRMETTWSRTERLVALRPITPESAALLSPRIPSILIRSAVAVAMVVALVSSAVLATWNTGKQTYETAIGGYKTLVLADGSRIELNTNTVLQVLKNDQRKVWLRKGEAYFQIKHDAAHPFVVVVGDRRITDLGTKFIVRQNPGHLDVAVVEGRVGFAAKNEGTQPLLLDAGDGVVATAQSLSVFKKSVRELANELGWRRGLLIFRHTALADAAAEFNRYNRERVVIGDRAAARLTIDGTFPAKDVRGFAEVAQAVFGLRVERHDGETLISR
jgi:transmembrane sensor